MARRTSKEEMEERIRTYLAPRMKIPTVRLRRVLEEDCGLGAHLEAIDGVFFMAGHDVWNDWTAWLFQQVSLFAQCLAHTLIQPD